MFVLFMLSDVKRLAEKEDWVVDNEGITSLVRMHCCVKQYLMVQNETDRHTPRFFSTDQYQHCTLHIQFSARCVDVQSLFIVQ